MGLGCVVVSWHTGHQPGVCGQRFAACIATAGQAAHWMGPCLRPCWHISNCAHQVHALLSQQQVAAASMRAPALKLPQRAQLQATPQLSMQGEGDEMKKAMEPVLYEHGVDFVFCGEPQLHRFFCFGGPSCMPIWKERKKDEHVVDFVFCGEQQLPRVWGPSCRSTLHPCLCWHSGTGTARALWRTARSRALVSTPSNHVGGVLRRRPPTLHRAAAWPAG